MEIIRQYGRHWSRDRDRLATCLADGLAFRSGAMHGARASHYNSAGRLDGLARSAYLAADYRGELAYIIYSYATPIAWRTSDGSWFLPTDSYSVTTSRHQTLIRVALGFEETRVPTLADARPGNEKA